jgi:hypothetical protein
VVAGSCALGRRALSAPADRLGAERDRRSDHGEKPKLHAAAPPPTLRCYAASLAKAFIRIRAGGNHGKAGYSRISAPATYKRALSAVRCVPE